jgi:hypothetical protein
MYLISKIMLITCLRGLRVRWNSKSEIEKFLHRVDKLAHSAHFDNLLELNQTTLPKEKLFLMTSYTSVQIYKKFRASEVFVLRVQRELNNSVPDKIFQISS